MRYVCRGLVVNESNTSTIVPYHKINDEVIVRKFTRNILTAAEKCCINYGFRADAKQVHTYVRTAVKQQPIASSTVM